MVGEELVIVHLLCYPPESYGRGEVGSADGEASPPLASPGLTMLICSSNVPTSCVGG